MDDNEIIELDGAKEDTLYDEEEFNVESTEEEIKVEPKKKTKQKKDKNIKQKPKKEKKPCFFKRLSKKGKIVAIIVAIIIVCAITAVILLLTVFKKTEEKENIVIQGTNYVYENGNLKFLNSKKKEIGNYECVDKDAKKCYVAKLSNEDDFDTEKYLDSKNNPLEQVSKIYNDQFVFIYDDGVIGLYDLNKNKMSGEYKLIKTGNINKDYVVVKDKNDKYGVIDILVNKAKTIIEPKYEYLGIINSDSTFVVKNDSSYFLIDSEGNQKTINYVFPIKSFNEKYVAVAGTDGYMIYDYDGNDYTGMYDGTIDYAKFDNGYIHLISNKKLYIYNDARVNLNPSGVKLKSIYYNKTYVFDDKNELKETLNSYEVKYNEGSILVILNDKSEVNINTYENELNAKYEYVSYLDGTLFFYEDVEKTILLGKYNCSNKNTIEKGAEGYTNCFVAKEDSIINQNENGYIPIINNTYAFIYDTKTGSTTKNIVLYNLKTNKVEVKYQSVDTGVGIDKITSATLLNNIIYAINSKGNYLAITFGPNGPEKIIDSSDSSGDTKSLKLFGDNILVTRGSKNILYTKTGAKLAEANDEIIEFKDPYYVTQKGKKYTVYNSNSGKVLATELDYYNCADDYFVGIKGTTLNVYSYVLDGANKNELLGTGLTVTDTNYDKAYSITVNGSGYVLTINGEDHNYDSNWKALENTKKTETDPAKQTEKNTTEQNEIIQTEKEGVEETE